MAVRGGDDDAPGATADQKVRAALQFGDARARRVVDAAIDPFIAMDADGRVIDWNAQAELSFGWTREEAVGQVLANLIIPERYRDAHTRGLQRFLKTGVGPLLGRRVEVEARRRDGTEFPVELAISPIQEEGRTFFGAFLRDLTERRRHEAMRDLLRRVAVTSTDATTVEEALAVAVRATCELLGWPVGHAWRVQQAQRRFEPMDVWYLDPIERYEPFRDATMSTSWSFGEGLPGVVQKTGRAYWVPDLALLDGDRAFPRDPVARKLGLRAAFAFPVKTGSRVAYVIELLATDAHEPDAALHDLFEQVGMQIGRVIERTANVEERVRNAELERSNRELQAFAYSASHDLKAPLTVVMAYLEVLRRKHGEVLGEPGLRTIGKAADAAAQMRTMMDGLLAWARVDAGPVAATEADLGASCRQAIENLRTTIDEAHAEITVAALPKVAGDELQLTRVLQNLLSNALKFHGEAPTRIDVHAVREVGHWRIDVTDNGLGFDPAGAQRLFALFGRLPEAENIAGTGIGLAISRRIVERHGGRIWATSSPGQGATFSFTLPAADATDHGER